MFGFFLILIWYSTQCNCDKVTYLASQGFWVDGKLNMSQEYALLAKRTNHILGCIHHGTASLSREVIVPPCTAMAWPHFEYCAQSWVSQYKKDMKLLECVQGEGDQEVERPQAQDL